LLNILFDDAFYNIKLKIKIMKRKNYTFFALCISIGLMLTGLNSCKKDDPAPAQKNIVEIVVADPNFSLLKQAVVKAGLTTYLSQGSLTVFAPDNAAFAQAGIDSATIASIPADDLAIILKYHVLNAKVEASGVPVSDTVNTLDGLNLYASSNANGVFVNGIKVKTANVQAANGVIHVISDVLIPPTETIAEFVSNDGNFDILLAAVVRAGLATAVSSNGKYTVFAPTDDAFAAAGFTDVASINLAPQNVVTAIVKAHIIGTNVFAGDLINASSSATLQADKTLTFGTNPATVKITGSANPASNVTEANITTTNGVIHVIDKVLL
jgi:uncharacterized surface protein with fasciclin (FAS1) repeats